MKFSDYIVKEASDPRAGDIKKIISLLSGALKVLKGIPVIWKKRIGQSIDLEEVYGFHKGKRYDGFEEFVRYYHAHFDQIHKIELSQKEEKRYCQSSADLRDLFAKVEKAMFEIDRICGKLGFQGHTWDPDDYATEDIIVAFEDMIEYWENKLKAL